jgi:PAS domain S-box-containing protein
MSRHWPDPAAALDALADGVVIADATSRIVAVNATAERMLGTVADNLVGRPLTDLMPDRYRQAHLEAFSRCLETGEPTVLGRPLRVPTLRADGSELPVDLLLSTFIHDGQPHFLGALRDVRDRVELESRQAVSARLLEVLAASGSIAEAAPRVLAALGDELGWDVATLWVVDTSRRRLNAAALWHATGLEIPAFALLTETLAFTPGEGMPGRVWQDGKPIWIQDVVTDPNFPRAAAAAQDGLHAACAFPVTAGPDVLGVIELLSTDPRRPDEALLDAMATIGELLGEFLERRLAQEALVASKERLGLALQAGRMGTWELDLQSGHVAWSDQAATLLGVSGGAQRSSVAAYLAQVHPSDRSRVERALEEVGSQAGELRMEHRIVRTDGSLPWIEVVGRVMLDAAGRRILVGVAADITERKTAEQQREGLIVQQQESRRRMTFLADASAELASSLEHRDTLAAVARRVTGEVADWCRIYGCDPHGPLYVLATAASNPVMGGLLDEVDRRFPPGSGDPFGPGKAARSGRPEFHPTVSDDLLARAAHSPEHLAVLTQLGMRSYIAVPMTVRGRTLGVLTLGLAGSARRRFTGEDLELAEELGRRAAQAIENSRLYQDLRRGARALQASLLPPELPAIPGLQAAARYRPMGESEVGGDFYDLFPLRGQTWGVVVGDVRGKGPQAAGVTGLARWAVRGAAMQTKRPHRVLANLNETMLAADSGAEPRFCTIVFGRLRPREDGIALAVASGGHPLPIVLRADGSMEAVGGQGMLVGAVPDAEFRTDSSVLGPGDTAVFFTDGVLEARDGKELLGEQGFAALLHETAGLPPHAVIAHIEARIDAMDPGPRDDIALLVLRAD